MRCGARLRSFRLSNVPPYRFFHLYTVWRLTLRRIAASVTLFLCPLPYPLMKAGSLLPIYILPRTARCGPEEGDAAPPSPRKVQRTAPSPANAENGAAASPSARKVRQRPPANAASSPRGAQRSPKRAGAAPDTVGKRPRHSPYALRVASTAFSPLMFHSLT